jgi:ABC-2 type transport system permease protein
MTTDIATAPVVRSGQTSGAVRNYPLRDTLTLLRRNIKNQMRDKVGVLAIIAIPSLFLLLFVYVFGGALGKTTVNLGAPNYVDWVLPGLIIQTAAAGLIGVSTHSAIDMTEGFVSRLRTMPVFSHAILLARVISYLVQTLVSMVVVFGIAMLMGFTTSADLLKWLAIIGFVAYVSFALIWLGLAFGLAAKSMASASNGPFPLIFLPLVGSGIVPPQTMPTGLRYFAQYQPFSPMIDTLRGLMLGTPIGNSAYIALAWITGIGLLGFFWSMKAFKRERPS